MITNEDLAAASEKVFTGEITADEYIRIWNQYTKERNPVHPVEPHENT